ncbi:MAG: hypothetical protein DCC67_10665 [Planctomycetota bacterium]|nr:MAG: hypothetical protein DCC67_10665 [Planctomycetota bacterium]
MQRRQFIQASIGGAAAVGAASDVARAQANGGEREVYEWRTYRFDEAAQPVEGQERVFAKRPREYFEVKHALLHKYLQDAALPAWKRMGLGPVGVFTETGPEAGPSIHVLITYPHAAAVTTAREQLEQDAEYQQAAADYRQAKRDDPAFVQIESWLLLAFAAAPKITLPQQGPRVLELRTYANHNEATARRKIDMFNEGEIGIFPECGFQNVFFGEALIGGGLPCLKYMLAAPSLEANAAGWKRFIASPKFAAMRDNPRYADTEPKITRQYLEPAAYSQV